MARANIDSLSAACAWIDSNSDTEYEGKDVIVELATLCEKKGASPLSCVMWVRLATQGLCVTCVRLGPSGLVCDVCDVVSSGLLRLMCDVCASWPLRAYA